MENVSICPICEHDIFVPYLQAIDHTITKEKFQLTKCSNCDFIITNPRPTQLEIGKYYASEKYISHSGKSETVFDKIYLGARHYTLQWKYQIIKKHLSLNGNVLDYGCGTGDFLYYLKQKQLNVIGIEPNPLAREKANSKLEGSVLPDLHGLNDTTFQIITLWHVLEHVHDLNKTITALKRLLTPDGYILIAVPNPNSYDSKKYDSHWAGYDVPRHLWHFTQTTMSRFLKRNGLVIEQIKPMKLDSYYVSLLSEQYKNPLQSSFRKGIKAFYEGLISNYSAMKSKDYSSLIYIVKSE